MPETVIVDIARTPFIRRRGALAGYHPVELLGHAQTGILERNGVPATTIGQVVTGCVTQAGEQSSNVGRTAWLHAGLPRHVGATTVDCQCGSGQQALNLVTALISSGTIRAGIACGVEAMSRIPLMSNFPGPTGRPRPDAWDIDLPNQYVAADRIATDRGITREDLDAWGLRSHQRATQAWNEGRLDPQIIPIAAKHQAADDGTVPDGDGKLLSRDNGMRDTSLAKMAELSPVLEGGLHTAGTASQVTDGATAALLMDADLAAELGLNARARVIAHDLVGSDPYYHLDGPVEAAERLLTKARMKLDDIDLFEVNEAFASVPLSFCRATGADEERVNVNGGAIAVGHPVGASGIRLLGTALNELERQDSSTAFVSMCAGGALASGSILERIG